MNNDIDSTFNKIRDEIINLSDNKEDRIEILKNFNNKKVNEIYDLAGAVFTKFDGWNKKKITLKFYFNANNRKENDKFPISDRNGIQILGNGLPTRFEGFSYPDEKDYDDIISCVVNNLKEYYVYTTSYILKNIKKDKIIMYEENRKFYRNKLVDCLHNFDKFDNDMKRLDAIFNLEEGKLPIPKNTQYPVEGITFNNSVIYYNGVNYIQATNDDPNRRRILFATFAYVLKKIEKEIKNSKKVENKNKTSKKIEKIENVEKLDEILNILKRNIRKVGIGKEDLIFDAKPNAKPNAILEVPNVENVKKINQNMGYLYDFIKRDDREKIYEVAINNIFQET